MVVTWHMRRTSRKLATYIIQAAFEQGLITSWWMQKDSTQVSAGVQLLLGQ